MYYEGRYYPRGDTLSHGEGGYEPTDCAIDFTLAVGDSFGYVGKYLGMNKRIPEEICKQIDAAIIDLLHDDDGKPLSEPRVIVRSRQPYVRLTKYGK